MFSKISNISIITKKKMIVLGSIGLTIPLLLLITHPAYADMWDGIWSNAGGQDTVDFLNKYKDYLSYGNFFTVILNSLAWFFIKGLYWLTSSIEGLIPQSLNLLDFLNDSGVQGITKAVLNDLVGVLMVLTIVFLGFKTVIAKEPPNFKSVGVNIFISAFLIMGLPSLMSIMQDMSVKFYNDTQSGGNNDQTKSLSWNLIQGNTADLLYVSDKGFSILDTTSKKNTLTPDLFYTANLSELITPDVVDKATGDEIKNLDYRLDTDETGKQVADKIQGGAFGFISSSFNEGYFRYQAKFFPIIFGLVALAIAYLFTIFVLISTIIEIGVKQIVASIIFATDLETGQKTKMVVQDIMNAFLLIAFTGLNFKIYTSFLTYLGTKDLNIIVYVIALISSTFFLIRGSDTIMRYFGVDVGVKEGFGQLAGAFALGAAATRGVSSIANGAKKAGQSAKNAMKPNSENGDDATDQLKQKGEDGIKSINDSKANGTGSKLKGISGKSLGNFASALGGGLKNSINSANMNTLPAAAGDDYSTGMAGTGTAQGGSVGKRTLGSSMNGTAGRKASASSSAGAHEIQEGQNQAAAARNSINGNRSAGMNRSIRDGAGGTGTGAGMRNAASGSAGDVLTNMRLKDAMNPQKNFEGNMRLNSNANTSSINQSSSTQGARTSPVNNLQSSSTNGSTMRQTVQQDVRAGAAGSNPVRQTVTQDIKTNAAGSSPVRQVIQQDVRAAGSTPNNTVRQSVVQDVQQRNMNMNPVRQEVIQDVKTVLGNTPSSAQSVVQTSVAAGPKESVRQTVVQDIQRAASPAVEQLNQTVKQTVETTNQQYARLFEQQEVKTKETRENSYFGSLFGDYKPRETAKKTSRFDFITKDKS